MRNPGELVFAILYVLAMFLALPIGFLMGWRGWFRHKSGATLFSVLSLVAFGLATSSAFLAVGSIIYAHAIGGFPFYDPHLLRIYRLGGLLSLGGVAFGVAGCWRQGPLRWYAPLCAFGTLVFWAGSAMGE